MKPIKSSVRIHPVSQECLQRLCDDPFTTVCIFSGSERNRLSQAFAHLPKLWIAAENGCFIRSPLEGKHGQLGFNGGGKWITMVETSNLDWLESVQLVFDYFCERTPRSYVETRETSLVWSYKYADPDFGRQQAKDLLQHLWTGPISNAAVDVIQGAKSVEVRPIGVSKGAAVERIVSMMGECGSSSSVPQVEGDTDVTDSACILGAAEKVSQTSKLSSNRYDIELDPRVEQSNHVDSGLEHRLVDFVICCGHFLGRDEDIFEYIDRCASGLRESYPVSTAGTVGTVWKAKGKGNVGNVNFFENETSGDSTSKVNNAANGEEKFIGKSLSSAGDGVEDADSKSTDEGKPPILTTFGFTVTCTVGRKRSGAAYYVNDSDDIAELLATLTNSLDDGKGRIELLQFDAESSLGSSRSLAELARYGSMVNMSTNLSRQGSVVDVTAHRYGRNQSVSNFSDNSSLECGNKGDAQVKIALPNDHSASISAEACKVSLQS